MSENGIVRRGGEILIYQTEGGQTKLEVRLEGETLWLSQADLARLYQTTKQNISLHIQNIYEEGELDENSVVKEYLTTAADGKNYKIKHYNLDMIISVGYRIKSHIATHFRHGRTAGQAILIKQFNSSRLGRRRSRIMGAAAKHNETDFWKIMIGGLKYA